ncbi:MurR/RpiR family transcriptional regulator [Lactovum miscens]|uniref:DNA-binding MurR/RpiR family transcriptional regulator n=1 Tax=Lactovum miscens TaxID=190387 RepID=A0A841CBI6_9LACT|nr:MurR/RpiR family transcriptional regulator [Lactovum miscens]MBB5888749.1 DNA-binding MurR/RpiR family transcriptional regulator [Lactovum miscens]
MFETVGIRQLNFLETQVFNALIADRAEVENETIRGFAARLHVSTSTVMHVCKKLGFEGWTELKYHLKNENNKKILEEQDYDSMLEFSFFLNRLYSNDYQKQLNQAAKLISDADYCIFCGVGASGSLCDYGSKYFVNIGLSSFVISDPFQAVQTNSENKVVALILSESGNTDQVVKKTQEFKSYGAKIISITNSSDTAIAKLADLGFTYNLMDEWSKQYPQGNLTTQLPVIAIIETLAHKSIVKKGKL